MIMMMLAMIITMMTMMMMMMTMMMTMTMMRCKDDSLGRAWRQPPLSVFLKPSSKYHHHHHQYDHHDQDDHDHDCDLHQDHDHVVMIMPTVYLLNQHMFIIKPFKVITEKQFCIC